MRSTKSQARTCALESLRTDDERSSSWISPRTALGAYGTALTKLGCGLMTALIRAVERPSQRLTYNSTSLVSLLKFEGVKRCQSLNQNAHQRGTLSAMTCIRGMLHDGTHHAVARLPAATFYCAERCDVGLFLITARVIQSNGVAHSL